MRPPGTMPSPAPRPAASREPDDGEHSSRAICRHVRPNDRRRHTPRRHLARRRRGEGLRYLRRRMPARRRQDAARWSRPRRRRHQCRRRARLPARQRAGDRSRAWHRQGRPRHEGWAHRRNRQGWQSRRDGRRRSAPHRRRRHHRARLRGHDRHAGRHRRARALRLRRPAGARDRVGPHDDARRLARPDHCRHRFRWPVQHRADAAGRRGMAGQFRLPRSRQLAQDGAADRAAEDRLHGAQDPRGLGRDAGDDRRVSLDRRRVRFPGAAFTPTR